MRVEDEGVGAVVALRVDGYDVLEEPAVGVGVGDGVETGGDLLVEGVGEEDLRDGGEAHGEE